MPFESWLIPVKLSSALLQRLMKEFDYTAMICREGLALDLIYMCHDLDINWTWKPHTTSV